MLRATFAVQGFGNVGYFAATFLAEQGSKLIAVTDSSGGAYNPGGLNPELLLKHKSENGSVKNFPGSKEINTVGLYTLDCDILVPAALENQITAEIAQKNQSQDYW